MRRAIERAALAVCALVCCAVATASGAGAVAKGAVSTSAAGMAVLEVTTGRVLFAHDSDRRLPMASTTKIITALTVLERCALDEIVTVDRRAQGVEGSSIYLAAGERLTVEDLLYGMMLQSGNDAAAALAYHVGGSIEAFADLCNATVRELGAVNTHVVNPHGLHDPDHYTTAYDLALIAAHALRNDAFRKIVSTKYHVIKRDEGHFPTGIANKNKLLSSFEGATGVKTGYTKAAGRCLVASAERDGMQVVAVVLNCGPMFEECASLMEAAFDAYTMTEILPAYTHVGKLDTVGSMLGGVNVYTRESFSYPLREGEESGIYCKVELPDAAVAPLPKDAEIGKIKIFSLNQLLFATKIFTMEEVTEITYRDKLELIVENWLHRA